MLTNAVVFFTAVVLALVLTPLMRSVALHFGAVSSVGGRNVNTTEIPRLGGVAVALATLGPLTALFVLNSQVAYLVRARGLPVSGILIGALCMCLLGGVDDVRSVRANHKLMVQVVCALLAYFTGIQLQLVHLPLIGDVAMGVFALPVTVIWIVGVTNAVNLIDGLDGLAAGVVFCAAATILIVSVVGGALLVAVLMAALMGALLGFLYFNFNPASIFLGDSGSYFAGFVLATASLLGSQKSSAAVALLVPVLALGVPIFDVLFSIVRRTVYRRALFAPDQGHVHHRLVRLGLTHRRAVVTLYGVSVLFAVSAIAIALGRDWLSGCALFLASVLVSALFRLVTTRRGAKTVAASLGSRR